MSLAAWQLGKRRWRDARIKKTPPNRAGSEIWRDMVAWSEQRRRQNGSGDHCSYDFVAYQKNHKPKDDKKKEQDMNGNINGNLAYEMEPEEEIIGGEVVMMAPATINHNRVVRNISSIFDNYLKGKTCEYFPDGAGLYLEQDAEEYKPDGMVVCDPDKVKGDSGVYGAPDLVVEILSPSTAKNDRGRKKDVYEKHGVREYWIVNPLDMSVEQYVLENGRFVLWDVYHKYTAAVLNAMKEKDREKVVTEFKCSLFPDLIIRLDDIFGRVVIR